MESLCQWNVITRAHANLILDITMYYKEFVGGEVTKSTANIIADSMCTQCDAGGNKYLLLDSLINYHNDDKAIFFIDQQTSIWGRPITCKTTFLPVEGWFFLMGEVV